MCIVIGGVERERAGRFLAIVAVLRPVMVRVRMLSRGRFLEMENRALRQKMKKEEEEKMMTASYEETNGLR